jgi:hypothetical protein
MVESADARPVEALTRVAADSCQALRHALASWHRINVEQLPGINASLTRYGVAALPVVSSVPPAPACQ